jgi:hypothetical protein
MKIEQKSTDLLINEWQLGQQLNTAVHNGTREKFNLLLSFLSDDARDFAQFAVPSQPQTNPVKDKTDLRSAFSLADAQPLVNKGMSTDQAKLMNQNVQDDNLSSIRLQLLLSNEALLSRSEALLISSDVNDNLTFLSQQRLAESLQIAEPSAEQSDNKPSGINHQLMEQYQAMNLENNPIKVTYM